MPDSCPIFPFDEGSSVQRLPQVSGFVARAEAGMDILTCWWIIVKPNDQKAMTTVTDVRTRTATRGGRPISWPGDAQKKFSLAFGKDAAL